MSKEVPNFSFDPTYSFEQAAKTTIVEQAELVGKALTGNTDQIKWLFDNNELVVAVWRESDEFAVRVIKGKHLLDDVVASDTSRLLSWTAIPCASSEHASVLQQICDHHGLH